MKYIVLFLIKIYQKCISPLFPSCCRFYPTCSGYAVTAVKRFGAVKGTYLAVKRILRCHPWNIGGIDYVPKEFPGFFKKKRHVSESKRFGSVKQAYWLRKGKHIL